MALVEEISAGSRDNLEKHEPVHQCVAFTFNAGDGLILQLDTYGSPDRKNPDKASQVIQFNEHSARQLKSLLDEILSRNSVG